jgi:hypothetical protein
MRMEIILYFQPPRGKIMKIPPKYRKHAFSAALVIALAASLATFSISYRLDYAHASEAASLARHHWLYAVEMNDDMAVIDWSKNLENLDNVKAFQASVNGKSSASGGNRHFLPSAFREGVFFVFPDTWTYGWRDAPLGQNSRELILVFRFRPGPVLLCFLVFLSCIVTAFLAGSRVQNTAPLPSAIKEAGDPGCGPGGSSPLPASVEAQSNDAETAFLFLDKQFIIRRVSSRAASILGQGSEHLPNGHLLDLSPGPRLMEAIENAETTRLSDAFPSRPGLCVRLKPDPHGIFLFLESNDGSSGA